MTVTERLRKESDEFEAGITAAREAALALLQEDPDHQWPGGALIQAIKERAGVKHDFARYAEDELVIQGLIEVVDGRRISSLDH